MIPFWVAQVICLAIMAMDMLARTWRIMWLLRGVGQTVSFRDALILNAFGDAACAITPARLGGEPSRLAGMLRAQVRPEAGFVAIGYEVFAAWPVVIGFAVALLWLYAPEWLVTTGPDFIQKARDMWPWLVVVAGVTVVAALAARRMSAPWAHWIKRPANRVRLYWRKMPIRPLVVSLPLTAVNVVGRTAILPILAMTLANPPPFGPMVLGSFALLYSQLVLPTPAGVGGVEFGFFAGAAGRFEGGEGLILALWRFYTLGLGVLLGGYFLVTLYGWPTARRLIVGRRGPVSAVGTGAQPVAEESVESPGD